VTNPLERCDEKTMIKEMNTWCLVRLVRINIPNNKMNTEEIKESLLKAFLRGSGLSIGFF